jgi:hypothetical protein
MNNIFYSQIEVFFIFYLRRTGVAMVDTVPAVGDGHLVHGFCEGHLCSCNFFYAQFGAGGNYHRLNT